MQESVPVRSLPGLRVDFVFEGPKSGLVEDRPTCLFVGVNPKTSNVMDLLTMLKTDTETS